MLPRQAEGKRQNAFSSAQQLSCRPPGTGAVRGGGRPLLRAGSSKARGAAGVDLRKLRGELGKLWSWQGPRSWEEGGARRICLFLAGCLEEGVSPARQAAGTEKGLQEVTGFSLGHIYPVGHPDNRDATSCSPVPPPCLILLPPPRPLFPHSRTTIS